MELFSDCSGCTEIHMILYLQTSFLFKGGLLDIEFLVDNLYFFSTLNMLPYCLLASMATDKELTVNYVEISLLMMFSLLSRFTLWFWYLTVCL